MIILRMSHQQRFHLHSKKIQRDLKSTRMSRNNALKTTLKSSRRRLNRKLLRKR